MEFVLGTAVFHMVMKGWGSSFGGNEYRVVVFSTNKIIVAIYFGDSLMVESSALTKRQLCFTRH